MAWLPISYTVPQYVDSNGDPYSGAVLKAYQVGTTTNVPFATTNEGTTTANSIALNSDGFPEVSGNVVIPHLDQDYKLAIYPDQTAADSDSGAIWTVDDIDLLQTDDETQTAADYNVWPLVDYGGAYFDGTNDYLTRGAGLTGAADGKKGTVVAFVTFDSAASAAEYIFHATGDAFLLQRTADGKIQVSAENGSGTGILDITTSESYESNDTVYCIMASWDLTTPGSGQIYVNDSSDVIVSTFTNDTIDYTVADWAVGADVSGSNKLTGNVLSLWFDPTTNMDFDAESNRRKFLDEQDNPVYVGDEGHLPTGSQVILYLGQNGEDHFQRNRGSGGDFTENGAMAASTVTFDGQYHIDGYDKHELDAYAVKAMDDAGTDAYEIDLATDLSTSDTFLGLIDSANTTASPTAENTGGSPSGAQSIVDASGNSWIGMLENRVHRFQWDGTNIVVLDPVGHSGVWVPLIQASASSDAAIEFTSNIDDTYDVYVITMVNVKPATDNDNLNAETSTDGGANWDTSNNYAYANRLLDSDGSLSSSTNTAGSALRIVDAVGNQPGEGFCGELWLFAPSDSSMDSIMKWDISWVHPDGGHRRSMGGGRNTVEESINAIRFKFGSGNINSGEFRLYGVRNS